MQRLESRAEPELTGLAGMCTQCEARMQLMEMAESKVKSGE